MVAILGVLVLAPGLGAQPAGKAPRIGVLLNTSGTRNLADLQQGLRELGYIEGSTIALEILSAQGMLDRLPHLARELVRRNVDVVVASGPSAIAAVRAATTPIPIVMGRMDDVEVHGFVTNLAHPGGNITGLPFQTGELASKWIDLLREAVPRLARLAVLWDAAGTARQRQTAEDTARGLGATNLDEVFVTARTARAEALAILASPALTGQEVRLAQLSVRHRLPAVYYSRGFAQAGGLMSYGPDLSDFSWRRAAAFVDRILKGARPGDLPIEQPTRLELVINLKTARTLGLSVPPTLRLRADQVIE